ncbi:MAG TPA: ABC transporter substrate-binding protein [Chloroflexota bacterium]|nr:ABC transporter substrate-binding protein [Chloroflexota bacterium]
MTDGRITSETQFQSSNPVTRRRAISGFGLAGLAAVLTACGGSATGSVQSAGSSAAAGAGSSAAATAAGSGSASSSQTAAAASAGGQATSNRSAGALNGPVSGKIAFSWWGTGERNTKTEAVMTLFTKKYPQASIQGVPIGDFTTYWQKLTVEAAAHNLPDVPQMQVRYMSAYDTRNALRPLDDLTSTGAIDVSGIPKVVVDSGRGPDGKLYMIPTGSATNNWMYNETMVTAAGLPSPTTLATWDAIQKWLLQAKAKAPSGVYACDLKGGDDSIWWAWVSSNGQKVFNKDGTLGFPKQMMTDYWNWWEVLRKAGATVPAAMNQEEPTSNVQTYLAQGKVMFDEAPANQLAAYQKALTTAGKGTMQVAAFPKTSSGNGQVLVNNGMSIAANTTNLATAAAWVNFFTNDPQGATAYASDNGTVTVTSLLDAQIAQATSAAAGTQDYLKFLKSVVAGNPTIIDFPANYNAVVLALKNNYSNVAFGKASVEAAVDAFFSQANAAAANK